MGEQSHGVVIPRPGGLGGTTGGHDRGGGLPTGRGGAPVGGGLAGSRSGTPAGGRGGGYTGGSSTALAPGRGKQMHVILDDEEVSFDEDEPLQKQLRQLSGAGSAVLDVAAVTMAMTNKEATDKRATEEATTKSVAEERAVEEAPAKAAAVEEAAGKTVDEAARATRGSPAPDQVPSVAGAKRVAAPSGSTLQGCLETSVCPAFSPFFVGLHSLITFLPRSSPSGTSTAMVSAAADAAVRATPVLAPNGEPRTPEGVPEDMVESEGEPEVALEPVTEVVQEEAPTEGAMITVCAAVAPPPSRGA
jgi:hypothetical protein